MNDITNFSLREKIVSQEVLKSLLFASVESLFLKKTVDSISWAWKYLIKLIKLSYLL